MARALHAQTPGMPDAPHAPGANRPATSVQGSGPQFNITPTRIVIPKGQTSASLVLRNDGTDAVRFQISAFAWSNDTDGQIVLHPTSDVVFFPMLFSVDPRDSRRIRIAVTARPIERELSYRLFVEQLPPSRAEEHPTGVRMVMRASIPVFVQPTSAIARASIDQPEIAGGRLSFVVRNTGMIHVSIAQVQVRAASRDAANAFDAQLPGWYLLAGETRTYHVTLPSDVCRDRANLTIAVRFADNAKPLTLDHPVGAGDCKP